MKKTVMDLVRQYWHTQDSIRLLKKLKDSVSTPSRSSDEIDKKIAHAYIAFGLIKNALDKAESSAADSIFKEVSSLPLQEDDQSFEQLSQHPDITKENNDELINEFKKKNEIIKSVRNRFIELLQSEDKFRETCEELANDKKQIEDILNKYYLGQEVDTSNNSATPVTPVRENCLNRVSKLVSFYAPSNSPLKLSLQEAKELENVEQIPSWLEKAFTNDKFKQYYQSQLTTWSVIFSELDIILGKIKKQSTILTKEEFNHLDEYRHQVVNAQKRASVYVLLLNDFNKEYSRLGLEENLLLKKALATVKLYLEKNIDIRHYSNMYFAFARAIKELIVLLNSVKNELIQLEPVNLFETTKTAISRFFKANTPDREDVITQINSLVEFLSGVRKKVDALTGTALTKNSFNEFHEKKTMWLYEINQIFTFGEELNTIDGLPEQNNVSKLLRELAAFKILCRKTLTDEEKWNFSSAIEASDRLMSESMPSTPNSSSTNSNSLFATPPDFSSPPRPGNRTAGLKGTKLDFQNFN